MILSGTVSLVRPHTHMYWQTCCVGWKSARPLWYVALLLVANENQISSEHKSRVSKINPPNLRLSIWESVWAHMSKRPAPVWSQRPQHMNTYTGIHPHHPPTPEQRNCHLPSSVTDIWGVLPYLFELEPFDCIRNSSPYKCSLWCNTEVYRRGV